MQHTKTETRKRRGSWFHWGAMALLLCVFCFSTYKLIDTLMASKGEQEEFESLSAFVAKERAAHRRESVTAPLPANASESEEEPAAPVDDAGVGAREAADAMSAEPHEAPVQASGSEEEPAAPVDDAGAGAREADAVSAEPHEAPVQASKKEQTVLPQYARLYEMNPDFFGWLSIEGTEIDFPVMYSPDRPEHYLNRAFDGSKSYGGVPFVDGRCSPDGNIYLIYGHHMRNKSIFGKLPLYAQQSYCEEHPIIRFDTRYEEREYQVIAAFYSRVYGQNETSVFRYYAYVDLSDEAVFDEYVACIRSAAIYDTGLTATYGDDLLALSTCNYHTRNGRFVVVARRVKDTAG